MELTLYHGTTLPLARHILKQGIRPRAQTHNASSSEANLPRDRVYLTDDLALAWEHAVSAARELWPLVAVVTVSVKTSSLVPCEKALATLMHATDGIHKSDEERAQIYAEEMKSYSREKLLRLVHVSLQQTSVVAFKGAVPAVSIVSIHSMMREFADDLVRNASGATKFTTKQHIAQQSQASWSHLEYKRPTDWDALPGEFRR